MPTPTEVQTTVKFEIVLYIFRLILLKRNLSISENVSHILSLTWVVLVMSSSFRSRKEQ